MILIEMVETLLWEAWSDCVSVGSVAKKGLQKGFNASSGGDSDCQNGSWMV